MKNIIFLSLATSLFVSCQNTPKNDVTVIDEEIIEELPSFSEIDFTEALTDYKSGKFKEAAQHIESAIRDIETESAALSRDAKDQVDKSIITLKSIESKIKKGEIADIDQMEKAFLQIETSLAHDYMFISSIYAIGQPKKARKNLEKAVRRMEYASKKLKGKSQEESLELLMKGNDLLSDNLEISEQWAERAKGLVMQMNMWREAHRLELFHTTSGYYPHYYL